MPLLTTKGAASASGLGLTSSSEPVNYIEDVFSTYLYTGDGTSRSINNGIDLSTKGGLVWIKARAFGDGGYIHGLWDTNRGVATLNNGSSGNGGHLSIDTNPQAAYNTTVTSFNTNGFSLGSDQSIGIVNYDSAGKYASWTFRKQPKFFDVVTWTGNGANYRAISHALGSTPGCVFVKSTSAVGAWAVWHRSVDPKNLILNSTSAAITGQFSIQDVSSTSFAVANSSFYGFPQSIPVNESGQTYVAYVFAHNAGGFGLTGTDHVISCGSLTADNAGGGAYAGGATVNLGYEPQFVLLKEADSTLSDPNWIMVDTFRGYKAQETGGSDVGQQRLRANTSGAEANAGGCSFPTSTGFSALQLTGGATYIYIAIRRGPMKVPTSGTSVFSPEAFTGNATTRTIGSITTDSLLLRERASDSWDWSSRLTGSDNYLQTNNTSAESSATAGTRPSYTKEQLGVVYNGATKNQSGAPYINYLFKRAPSFFDEVCYTGNSTNPTAYNHNLTVVPELLIIKRRTGLSSWPVFYNFVGSTFDKLQGLNDSGVASTGQSYSSGAGLGGAPTTTTFTLDSTSTINGSGHNFVAYLFATCAGVSKVGSYTGNGSSQNIDCGFTSGARFILIKRTDNSQFGDWKVFDSARGIVSGNDPYLKLNDTDAEQASYDGIDPYSAGFTVNQDNANLNISGATYIFLAIA